MFRLFGRSIICPAFNQLKVFEERLCFFICIRRIRRMFIDALYIELVFAKDIVNLGRFKYRICLNVYLKSTK